MASAKTPKPKAQPLPIVGARPYTGNTDGASPKRRAGMDAFIKEVIWLAQGAFWDNGSYGVRNMRGKESLSVHATGRAVDLSYRPSASKKLANRKDALEAIEKLCANANDLGIEMIIDYFPEPFGRAWKCDRQAWSKYSKPTVSGAPGGDWFHIEITPQAADSPIFVKAAFLKAFKEIHPY
jgi:hypothetical protein